VGLVPGFPDNLLSSAFLLKIVNRKSEWLAKNARFVRASEYIFRTTPGQGFLCAAPERVIAYGKYLRKVSDLKDLPDVSVKVAQFELAGLLSYLDYQGEKRRREEPHIAEIQHDSLDLFIFEYLEDFLLETFNLPVS
jgi:hypothetical protein